MATLNPGFAAYDQERTHMPVFAGKVDGFFRETHKLGLGTTENPLESGSTLTDNAVKLRDKLTLEGMVSDLLPAPGISYSEDRAADVWGSIVELFKNRTLLEVVTALRVYRNMIITSAEAPVSVRTGKSLRFTLELSEMLFAATETGRFIADGVSGPAIDRTSEVDGGDRASPNLDVL